MKEVDKLEKEGDMSEDEKFDAKERLQKSVDTHNNELDKILAHKENEIAR
jgi:ribosome recycling factor